MTEHDDEYFPVAAKRTSACPHCPDEIVPGDAIVRRAQDSVSCHHRCAVEQDEIDADPEAYLASQRAQWEASRQTDIAESIAHVEHGNAEPHGGRERPRKRKRRRSTA